jgi:class 3 adenylate cyclase
VRKPYLQDLHDADPADPLVQPPQYPELWTRPAAAALLASADAWPVQVLTLPYVGCAMVADLHGYTRTALVRCAPAAAYLRVDASVMDRHAGTGTTYSGYPIIYNFNSDGVTIQAPLSGFPTGLLDWPGNYSGTWLLSTTSPAIVAAPSAYLDRQAALSPAISAQSEAVEVEIGSVITVWTGATVADLESL